MKTDDKRVQLIVISAALFSSFVFAVVSVATNGWSNQLTNSLLQEYTRQKSLLWVVGCVVLIILGIICNSISAIIVLARFYNHGKGRAKLGGVMSIFAGVVFIVALAIFMAQQKPHLVSYGYSYALLWCAVPTSFIAGVLFFVLKDSDFLNSELRYSAAVQNVQ